MPTIQIGLDIATALSVIGAAIVFVLTQLKQSRKSRFQALRQQRVEHMSRLVADFSRLLEEGDKIVYRVRQAQAGRNLDVTLDDFTNFCVSIDSYIRINNSLLFEVWANEQEKAAIGHIQNLVRDWNRSLVEAVQRREEGEQIEIPSFDKLVEELTTRVKALSSLLRAEVEHVVM